MDIKIKLLRENAIIPSYGKIGDAGLDLTATSIIFEDESQISYGTDIAIEIPNGYVALIVPRSSIRNYDISLSNSVGVIDSGYRGELQATFNKKNDIDNKLYNIGDRVCQMIIIPYPTINFLVSDNLSDTERGEGGFGSSGV